MQKVVPNLWFDTEAEEAANFYQREVMELVVVRTQQRQFSGVVKDYLKRIYYGGDGWAKRSTCSNRTGSTPRSDGDRLRQGKGVPSGTFSMWAKRCWTSLVCGG